MLGHRGCRLGISFPEIYEMQCKAIFEALIECKNQKISRLFMTQNVNLENWGFAAEGFETTDGRYLEVIRP